MANQNDTFTKTLLHFDGADTSTTITDSNIGGSAHTWTANGNAQLDTAIKKFGTAALLLDGTGDYITTPDSTDYTLGSGDWTVDFWFNVAGGNGATRRICGQIDSAGGASSNAFGASILSTNVLQYSTSNGSNTSVVGTTTVTTAGWHHFAATRNGNILRLFVDGVQEGGDVAFTGSVVDSAGNWSVGRLGDLVQGGTGYWNGSLDELRISVGIARWTANFTPPGSEYIDERVDAGTFALAGVAASFNVAMTEGVGSFALTGIAAGLNVTLATNPGAYTLSGNQAILGVGMSAAVAAHTFTGNSCLFSTVFGCETGSYIVTGIDVSFTTTQTPPGAGKHPNIPSYIPQPAYQAKKNPPIQPIWDKRRQRAREVLDRQERLPVPMPPREIFAPAPQQVSYPKPPALAQSPQAAQQFRDAQDISDMNSVATRESQDLSDMQDVADIMALMQGIE